jgi:hypothetical protein
MKNSFLERITKFSYLSLAMIPLLKENINSIFIIICAILTMINWFKTKEKIVFRKEYWLLTIPFVAFFLYELISFNLNIDKILLHLPFLIFPLLFIYRPKYINQKSKAIAIKVFQISTLLQCFIYFIFFVSNHSLNKLFYVQNNIPFFREFVSENYFFEIHPTYFSSFLLISFTVSLLTKKKLTSIFHWLNLVLTVFFIFMFSSRMIFIILFLTIISYLIYITFRKGVKHVVLVLSVFIVVLVALIYPAKKVIGQRFNEIKTELNKPIIGDYYNSTNTRIAILKCSMILLKEVPFFGYGDALQSQLNECYKNTNDSDFYLKQTFNTHNYYFNLILYGGWLFLIIFLFYLYTVYKELNSSLLILVIFFQLLLINITENYFSRHYGIVLFTYFTSMFIFLKEKQVNVN